jgi:hypothetical protein
MSAQLINHSPDLKRLRDEGYSVYVRGGLLVIEDVPYVNANKEVVTGKLISKLVLSGQKASYSNDHVAYFIGDIPHHANGEELTQILHERTVTNLGNDIIANMSFSSKPANGYTDYHHKMTNYINILYGSAFTLDPSVTAKTYKAMEDDESSVFNYIDTNSSRASITAIAEKLTGYKLGLIGLGGTGSYILDFVAKTPVQEIHLFDGDIFHSHNAFRTPGAPTLDELNSGISKVDYLKNIYSKMHGDIYAHTVFMDDEHLEKMTELNFVFVAIDEGSIKAKVFSYLDVNNIPYIDVGLGINITDEGQLRGMIRTTSITSSTRHPLKQYIDLNDGEENAYNTNIQIAELNALNAALAVISWKQHAGFYQSTFGVGQTLFNLDTMHLGKIEDET